MRTGRILILLGIALAAGGCGGEEPEQPRPVIAAPVADRLAEGSDAIGDALDAGDVCTAAVLADDLRDETVTAINAGQIPPELQEDLMARVNELRDEVNCPPPPEEDEDEDEDRGRGKKKGKKNEEPPPTTETVPTEPIPTETGG